MSQKTQPAKCASCGAVSLHKGKLRSTGEVEFVPEDRKFFTLKTGGVAVDAYLCSACGAVTLASDSERVRELIKE